MKKFLYSLVFILIIFPMFVHAETITLCKSGCDYQSLDEALEYIENSGNNYTTNIIHIKDNNTYEITRDYDLNDKPIYISNCESLNREGFNETCTVNSINIDGNNKTIKSMGIGLQTTIDVFDFSNINDELVKKFSTNVKNKISNLNFNVSEIFIYGGEYNFDNCSFNSSSYGIAASSCSLFIKNSVINAGFFAGDAIGGPGLDGKVYLDDTNTYSKPLIRINYSLLASENEMASRVLSLIKNNNVLIELKIFPLYTQEFNTPGITLAIDNYIYYSESLEKTIKSNTKISEFESEIKGTYKNSVGYDDIKELPIEWKSENESIATLDNGTIKPIANGQVNLVGTRGDDIYTIHLTVDMPIKKTNEKKVRMAPSTKITLNSVFKDLDISSLSDDVWEISNPKVAKIVNGEIISLQKGETDIVAIINGVKYVYHLTVSDTLVSKEIKVPITGKNIKLWIVVVTALLLSVIGVCSYILIRKRK